MPLNKKGKKILSEMKKEYGNKKGESVFYAMENSGKLKGVKKASLGLMMGKKLMDKSKEKTGSYMPLGVAGVLEGNRQKLKYARASKGTMTNLKPVPAEKKNSLGKLPTKVRNKMGYAKYGKMMKASDGKSVKGYGSARTSGMGLQDESLVPGKNYEYIKDLID